ncbi:transposase [Moorena producens JHB]|uniref:Transposase n=1 Tax=Moorena producens (strain JHB) TaxID=1454205 RepID=A0A1D9G357_MOOP1|nr:hypothetical protein [Moorena producens]AOY81981.1 transposase [Moorena producens JHB]
MGRKPRNFQPGYSYHITTRCNNREFKLSRRECRSFARSDIDRALYTLRYIHGNPKAAKMRSGFFYDFSNYGSYERLTDDGLTQWHPAFLQLGSSLEECAKKYKGFCQRYKPKKKPARRCHWGSKLLDRQPSSSTLPPATTNARQARPPCLVTENELVAQVARKFIQANRPPSETKKGF